MSLSFFAGPSFSDDTNTSLVCSKKTVLDQSRCQVFLTDYLLAMVSLTESVSMQSYGGDENGTVFAFADCRRDLSKNDCILCVEQCKVELHSCLFFQSLFLSGRVYNSLDGCFLRYDDYRFFGEISDEEVFCGGDEFVGNKSLFRDSVGELVRSLGVKGTKNDGFSAGNVNKGDFRVFALVQCWRFLSKIDCEQCLEGLVGKVGSCLPKNEGSVLNSGCYLRYSTRKFYQDSRTTSTSTKSKGGGTRHLTIVLAVTSACIAILMLTSTVYFFSRKRIEKQRREKEQYDYLATVTDSKLIFSYETLEKATKYFHDSNKLGEGGSGHVYKGRLPDGRTVAIKRILFDTKQWAEHLFNEVNLISGINHKNHAKLLGYSVTGPESLLVYEYMPNQSLHDYFFGKKNVEALKWDGLLVTWLPMCGRRNNAFSENTISLVEMVWNSYQKGILYEEIDPVLKASFQEDATRVLKIGLLCAQASAELRPSMSKVAKMLMNNQQLPRPTPPPVSQQRFILYSTVISSVAVTVQVVGDINS
ncbi:Cysteine-rich receptor-like protein kinase 3 [Heracleum sosnowskyi]|uniref:Cysteine-rich receptor-like protein kinase 3 n=1 Tax=Heracleum sosnowskyi TaxID=360622 RepID=A0AAD8N749_9APIA|nr:Cysteine-rich receptor-like protein kinase 3 [Heracleum sosnowskyi]